MCVTLSAGLVTPGTANTAGIGLSASTLRFAGLSHDSSSLNCLYSSAWSRYGRTATRHDSRGLPCLSAIAAAGNAPIADS